MKLAKDEQLWESTRHWLKLLPDALVPKLFAMLRASCPTVLTHPFIKAVSLQYDHAFCVNTLIYAPSIFFEVRRSF